MKDYIVDEEQYLSPVVIVTTGVLIGIFALGLLYTLLLFVL